MERYLIKLAEFVTPLGRFFVRLGGGKQWQIGTVTVKLWPFVAFALILAVIVAVDMVIR